MRRRENQIGMVKYNNKGWVKITTRRTNAGVFVSSMIKYV